MNFFPIGKYTIKVQGNFPNKGSGNTNNKLLQSFKVGSLGLTTNRVTQGTITHGLGFIPKVNLEIRYHDFDLPRRGIPNTERLGNGFKA